MIEIRMVDGWVMLRATKVMLVLSRAEFIQALRRGKSWRRAEAMAARIAKPDERKEG
jgi:hypothetical protein